MLILPLHICQSLTHIHIILNPHPHPRLRVHHQHLRRLRPDFFSFFGFGGSSVCDGVKDLISNGKAVDL